MSCLRKILAVTRLAALPTVWSNCLAGWWLGGGGNGRHLPFLFGGASLIYLGGALMDGALHADGDGEDFRGAIPSRALSRPALWRWAIAGLIAGILLLFGAGRSTGDLGLALVFWIGLSSAVYGVASVWVIVAGFCRLFFYLVGASVGEFGVTGWSIWCGLALSAYVSGVSWFELWEKREQKPPLWPAALLAAPVLFALIMNAGPYRKPALLLSALLVLWCLRALRQTFWSIAPNVRRTVSHLIAGIVFVDLLATGPVGAAGGETPFLPRTVSVVFIILFGLTLVLYQLEERTLDPKSPDA